MRSEAAFDVGPGADVDRGPERAGRDIRIGGDLPPPRVEEHPLRVQVAGERPRLGPVAIVPVRGQASFNEAREHLPLERDRAAVLDEIEHHRLEHVTPRVDQVARRLRPRGLLHEPSDSVLLDGDDPERGRIVDRPQRDRADSAALLVRLDEAVQFDRVDHVSVVDRERPVNVPPDVPNRAGRAERFRLLDHADLDAEVVGLKELAHLVEAIIDGDEDFVTHGRQRIQRVDDLGAVHERDERLRAVQRERTESRAEAARDDHELHPRYEAEARLSIFWPRRSFGDNRDDVVAPEDHGPDAPDVVLFRLFRVFEDHVHVVVVSDELPLEDPVIFEQELDPLVDGFF